MNSGPRPGRGKAASQLATLALSIEAGVSPVATRSDDPIGVPAPRVRVKAWIASVLQVASALGLQGSAF